MDLQENRKVGILKDANQPTASRQRSSKSSNRRKKSKRNKQSPQREAEFVCNFCAKAFASEMLLEQHGSVHAKENERPFECVICGKRYKSEGTLDSHLKSNHVKVEVKVVIPTERSYKCELCDKTFQKKYNLTRHEHVHTKAKPFKCTTCGTAFVSRGNLNRHKKDVCQGKPTVRSEASKNKNKKTQAIVKKSNSEEQETSEMIGHAKKEEF